MSAIVCADALTWINGLADESVELCLTDPPYNIGVAHWDKREDHAEWLLRHLIAVHPKLTSDGSLVFFAGLGRHGDHPIFRIVSGLERYYTFRNWITWKKRRAYGKKQDYLYVREEILWFSKGPNVRFNIPLLDEKRGYSGFNPKYPAKSEYKRVGNVWTDIPELMRPKRVCQKPLPLVERLVLTHSNAGDLVIDPFAGTGVTIEAALKHGRRANGCDADPQLFA